MSDIVSQKLSVHQQHELLLALERAGISPRDAQRAIEHRSVAYDMVQAARSTRDDIVPHTPLDQAATTMGDNFHDVWALERHLGVKLSSKSKKLFLTVPFSVEVLQACRETHVLVACGALSLMDVWQAQTGLFYAKSDPWYGGQSEQFARSKVKAGWQLVCKHPVPDSTSKTWDEQNGLLGSDEQVPSASVLAQTILIHYLETGERLFETIYVRVSDVGSDGGRVHLGYFDEGGLGVGSRWDDLRHSYIGLSSSRKFS